MGRCYEFGVEIQAGCEQAMVVTAAGGACECRDCSTTCPGRFAGCATVVANPGRVPPSAPSWAVPGGDQSTRRDPSHSRPVTRSRAGDVPTPVPGPPAARRPAPAMGAAPMAGPPEAGGNGSRRRPGAAPADVPMAEVVALLRTLEQHQADHPADQVVEALQQIRSEAGAHQAQLADGLEAVAGQQAVLASEVTRVGAAVERLPADVGAALRRVAEVTERLTTEVAEELVRIRTAVDRLESMIEVLDERLARPSAPSLRDFLGVRRS